MTIIVANTKEIKYLFCICGISVGAPNAYDNVAIFIVFVTIITVVVIKQITAIISVFGKYLFNNL